MKLLILMMLPMIASGQAKITNVIEVLSVSQGNELDVADKVMDGDMLFLVMAANKIKTLPHGFYEIDRIENKDLTMVVGVKDWEKKDPKMFPVKTGLASLITMRGPQLLVDVKATSGNTSAKVEMINGGALFNFFLFNKPIATTVKDMINLTSIKNASYGLTIGITPSLKSGLSKPYSVRQKNLSSNNIALSIY